MGDPAYTARLRRQMRHAMAWGFLPAVGLMVLARASHSTFIGAVAMADLIAASLWLAWVALRNVV